MLIRHTLLYLPAQVIGPVAQFSAIVVFTHRMAPEPYGVFTYVLASQELVFFLCLSWWSQYTVRYLGEGGDLAVAAYRRSEMAIMLGTVVAQVVATILALEFLATPVSPALTASAVACVVTRCLNLHLGERARSHGGIVDYTVAAVAGPVLGLALALLAMALVSATPTVALTGYTIAQCASLVWLFARLDIGFAVRRPDPSLLRQSLSFGLPLIAAGLAAWVGANAIRLLVDHRIGAEAMGLVAVGWGLGHRLTSTASMFVTAAAFPLAVQRFRTGPRDAAIEHITMNGLLMFGIVLPAVTGLYLLQDTLVPLFIAAPFRATTLVVLPAALAAGLFRNIRTHVTDQVFILVERTRTVCLMTVMEAALVILGCVVGIAVAGVTGAATGSAIGYCVAMIAEFMVARAGTGLRFPLLEAGGIILATACMALAIDAILASGSLPDEEVTRIVLVVGFGIAAYVLAILVLFPFVTRRLWASGRHLVTRRLV